jgi:hypothetical protein
MASSTAKMVTGTYPAYRLTKDEMVAFLVSIFGAGDYSVQVRI